MGDHKVVDEPQWPSFHRCASQRTSNAQHGYADPAVVEDVLSHIDKPQYAGPA
jgi:hypothetical protein